MVVFDELPVIAVTEEGHAVKEFADNIGRFSVFDSVRSGVSVFTNDREETLGVEVKNIALLLYNLGLTVFKFNSPWRLYSKCGLEVCFWRF